MYSLISRTIRILGLISILPSCSGFERSLQEKVRRQNCKGEYIYRGQNDVFTPIATPVHTPRAPYPWENEAHLPRITKEFFRCKGSSLNPPYHVEDHVSLLSDCEGTSRHGLPILNGQENVYPILIELMNYLQKKTGRRVIITSGHRCPPHNTYVDPSKEAKASKHQIGAAVDFYVQGMEDQALEIASLLMQYYQEHPTYKNQKEWITFQRYERDDAKVQTQPWFNKEIFIKLYQKHEGRNGDNRHPYPYLSIQVRWDRAKETRVLFDWEKATQGYPHS